MNPGAWIKAEQKRREIQVRFASDHDEDTACEALRKIAAKVPDLLSIQLDLIAFAARSCEYDLARRIARGLLKNAPENPAVVEQAAAVLARFGQVDEAVLAWRRLARNAAHCVSAWTALARLAERGQRFEEAHGWIQRALQKNPRDATAHLVAAGFAMRQGRHDDALIILHPLVEPGLPPAFRYRALYQWGALHDAVDDYPAAAAAWQEAKRCVEAAFPREVAECRILHARLRSRRQRTLADLTPERLRRWKAEPVTASLPPITLLIGHPRSGTTLLEQVLSAHPQVVDIDEENAFAVVVRQHLFRGKSGGSEFDWLESAPPASHALARQDYSRRIAMLRELRPDTVILDKNPNLTDFAPYLLKPFPELRLLTARSDPRDIVLSCFRQAVPPDYANISWLNPAELAADCQGMLAGWERLRDTMGPEGNWMEVSYETLCSDFPRTAQTATGFLGLEWHLDQANYRQKHSGKYIASPTYDNVRAPVHTAAIGRWQNYANLLPHLFTPWVNHS